MHDNFFFYFYNIQYGQIPINTVLDNVCGVFVRGGGESQCLRTTNQVFVSDMFWTNTCRIPHPVLTSLKSRLCTLSVRSCVFPGRSRTVMSSSSPHLLLNSRRTLGMVWTESSRGCKIENSDVSLELNYIVLSSSLL